MFTMITQELDKKCTMFEAISPIGLLHICTCSAHQTSILPNILLFTSLIIYGPRNNDKNVH